MATLLLKKRFFSSPVAFARTVDVYRTRAPRGLDVDFDADYDEILGVDADELEEGQLEQPETRGAPRDQETRCPPLTDEDIDDLEWLQRVGAPLRGPTGLPARSSPRPTSRRTLRPDGDWNNERVVVFTEYVDTLDWIRDILRQHGLRGRP